MNTIKSKTPYDSSFSSSKRNFQLQVQLQDLRPSTTPTIITVSASPADFEPTKTPNPVPQSQVKETPMTTMTTMMTAAKTTISTSPITTTATTTKASNTSTTCITTSGASITAMKVCEAPTEQGQGQAQAKKKPAAAAAVLRLRSALSAFSKARWHAGLGSRVTVTLFGHRRGHVHFAFQEDPKSSPALVIQLATPTSGLVREMASGMVRIALECDKRAGAQRLLDEPLWRTYCNGHSCGFATRRECRPADAQVLKAVEPISMGAGVLPAPTPSLGPASEGELMYMRAKFDRVVGSRDSEAFYMLNPESGSDGPELSIYLLRV